MKFDVLGLGKCTGGRNILCRKRVFEGTDLFLIILNISYENQEAILAKLPSGETPDVMCGGSTIIVWQLQILTICGHICQLSDDDRGKLYERNLKDNGIYSLNNFYHQDVRTGRCLVFITPASERTMGTYLGASERLFLMKVLLLCQQFKILFSEISILPLTKTLSFLQGSSEMNKSKICSEFI